MQAAQFSIYARDKYDHLIGKGDAAVRRTTELPAGSITRLPVLLQAHGHYSAAWGLADLATTSSPSKDYTAWSTRRTAANARALAAQELIANLTAQQVAA